MYVFRIILELLWKAIKFIFIWFIALPVAILVGLANDSKKPSGR